MAGRAEVEFKARDRNPVAARLVPLRGAESHLRVAGLIQCDAVRPGDVAGPGRGRRAAARQHVESQREGGHKRTAEPGLQATGQRLVGRWLAVVSGRTQAAPEADSQRAANAPVPEKFQYQVRVAPGQRRHRHAGELEIARYDAHIVNARLRQRRVEGDPLAPLAVNVLLRRGVLEHSAARVVGNRNLPFHRAQAVRLRVGRPTGVVDGDRQGRAVRTLVHDERCRRRRRNTRARQRERARTKERNRHRFVPGHAHRREPVAVREEWPQVAHHLLRHRGRRRRADGLLR
ncbi:hypothetical protein PS639_06471 [Pseudomonas fluorescens]|nr:hypothetical protein PS639_06471 [Pseudomonas fluorescens]